MVRGKEMIRHCQEMGDLRLRSYDPSRPLDGQIAGAVSVVRDITDRRRAEMELRETEERFRSLAESVPALIWLYDVVADANLFVNRRFCEFAGREASALLGRGYDDLLHPDDVEALRPQFLAAVASGTPFEAEYRFRRHDGQWRWHLARSRPHRDATGAVTQFFGAAIDITDRKHGEEALREANLRLAEQDRRKDEFLAILSHELRNPLAPIRFALPTLRTAAASDAVGTQAVAIVERQSARLRRLIDDLLEVSRVATGKLELRQDRVMLSHVADTAIEAAAPSIAAGQHSLVTTLPEEPLWVRGDADRLTQVVANLLENAARYTPSGGQLELAVSREGAGGVVRVRDNGRGIPADSLETIFTMFHRIDRFDSEAGLGLGLSLARTLVQRHGGTIEARSEGVGRGAEFVIRLPLIERDFEPASSSRSDGDVAGGRPLKVLIVDDNVDLVESSALLVRAFGHDVQTADDGTSAVTAALVYQPDVVLLDLGLPGMSGLDVAVALRRHESTSSTHLVAMTGWGQTEDLRRTQAVGFNTHLTKPVEPDELRQLLARVAAESSPR
ncbi:MAG: PAS domain S-box protein [Vicinamibacterales bacterium]